MKTAAYARYSSDMQREASIDDQLRNVETYCARMKWPSPTIYKDQGISGSRNDRPGYTELLFAAENKWFDVLLIDDLSRLSRDHIELAQTIRRFKFMGIRVIGVSDGIDTAREGSKLETGLRGLMSEFYLDDLAKKTHRGLTGQALNGYSAGGLPYGYTSVHDGHGFKRAINEEQAKWVRYIFERYSEGASSRTIANELNVKGVAGPRGGTWAQSAIFPDSKMVGILANSIYAGRQVWNKTAWVKDPITGRRKRTMRPREEWVITESPETKIISDELWVKCETHTAAMRDRTSKQRQAGKATAGRRGSYMFSGLLRCGVCGGPYIMSSKSSYYCSVHHDRGDHVCNNRLGIKRSTVETVLLEGIKKELLSEEAYRAFVKQTQEMLKQQRPDTSAAKKQVEQATKELDNLMAAIRAGIITATTKAAVESAECSLKQAQDELEAIKRFEPTHILPRTKDVYRELVQTLNQVKNVEVAREVLRQLIGEIKFFPDNGSLRAEIQSPALHRALLEMRVAGTGFGHYLQPPVQFIGLR